MQRVVQCRTVWFLGAVLTSLLLVDAGSMLQADDWPDWGGPQRDIVWRETGIVDVLPAEKDGYLPRVWSHPVGEGYAGPAVANGRVYVMDFLREEGHAGTERLQCLDAETGELAWKHEYPVQYTVSYPFGPRATPLVDGNHVYSIGAMGDMICLDARTGYEVWKKNFVTDYGTTLPTWGMAATPLVYGRQLITLVGGAEGALIVSFDKETGEELWRAIDDEQVGYCPPMLYEFDGVEQVIVWHPTAISSLNPENGEVYWAIPFNVRAGLTIPTPRKVGNRLFVTAFYNGPRMIEVNGKTAKVLWQGNSESEHPRKTEGLHSIMPTPWMDENNIYGVCSYGQLRCLDADSGERIWETLEATGNGRWWNAFIIPHEDRFFICNEQGDLIIAKLSAEGYEEISRAKLIEPTRQTLRRMTIWSHPAFAMQSIFARNDKEIVRVDLAK